MQSVKSVYTCPCVCRLIWLDFRVQRRWLTELEDDYSDKQVNHTTHTNTCTGNPRAVRDAEDESKSAEPI